jgi:hypothetical protein
MLDRPSYMLGICLMIGDSLVMFCCVYLPSGLQECIVPRGVTNFVFLRKVGVGASREKS